MGRLLTFSLFNTPEELMEALEKAERAFQLALYMHAEVGKECRFVTNALKRSLEARSALASDTSDLLPAIGTYHHKQGA